MVKRSVAFSLLLLTACGDDTANAEGDTDGGTGGTDSSETNPSDPTSDSVDATGTSDGDCGPLALSCPEPVEVECEGPETSVTLQPPEFECSEWTLSDDAPPAFPVGSTDVTYTLEGEGEGEATECTTEVRVTDTVGPMIRCPGPTVLLRTEIGEVVVPADVEATDVCDTMPSVSATPMTLENSGMVTYEASDASGNVSSCQTDYTLVDAFAVPGFRIISARGEAEDTAVTLAWEPPTSDAVDGLRIESSSAEDGPWTEVATLGAGEQLFTDMLDDDALFFRVVSTTEYGDGGATAPRRAFQVAADGYDVRDVDVPNVPFGTTLYGVVRHPVALDEGPFPLVVVLHGNHGNCRSNIDDPFDYCVTTQDHDCNDPGGVTTPNAEGYIYFLETLAAQGYIAVSISGNAMNCRNDFIFERAELMAEHLRAWSAWNDADAGETATSFVGHVDMGRVGLVGHSRGGDAASNVPGVLQGNPIPGVDVQSVFAIAPTDFHDVEVPGADLAVLLPGCDLDVAPLVGMNHYDRSIEIDDGARRAQVFVLGMNHNFFNEEWRISEWDLFGNPNDQFCTPDDDALKLAQTHTLEALLGSWFEQTLMQVGEPEAFMQATQTSPSAFDLWPEQDRDALVVLGWFWGDDRRLHRPTGPAGELPGRCERIHRLVPVRSLHLEQGCDPFFNHVKRVARLLWQLPAEPMATFDLLGYDASGRDALAMRVVSRRSLLNNGLERDDFFVRLRDGRGNVAEVLLSDAKPLRHLYPHSDPLEVLETFQLRLEWFVDAEPALDLGDLAALEFDMTATGEDGSVIVSDIQFL